MQSKWLFIGILIFSLMVFQPGAGPAHAQAPPAPQAFLPQNHVEFPPVFEGQEVRHEFMIQNKGSVPLAITDVQTG